MHHTVIDGLEFAWSDDVLRPRRWTALQAQWAVECSGTLPPGPLLELCCGVGTVGLPAVRDSGRSGVLVDGDATACEFARRNARHGGLRQRVRVVQHRVDGGAVPTVRTGVHLVLADPPHVSSAEARQLDGDPMHAVDGGDDGLDMVPAVLGTAALHLAVGGLCLLQVRGPAQAEQVAQRLEAIWQDLALQPRDLRVHDDQRAVMLLMRHDRAG